MLLSRVSPKIADENHFAAAHYAIIKYMFTLGKPSDKEIGDFVAAQSGLDFSYAEVGETKNYAAPAGYPINHLRRAIGTGERTYAKAVEALGSWQMYANGWTEIHLLDMPVRPSEIGDVLVIHYVF